MKGEARVHQYVCDYLRLQYPNVIFRTDFAAGTKMTPGQAAKHKRLQSNRAYPDLFIAEPVNQSHGLYIELKDEGVKVFKKNGDLVANPHIREQAAVLEQLSDKGYEAYFASGFNEAKYLIDKYLSGQLYAKNNKKEAF